tara:strand:- start:131 stop:253 length:123 start_codon:yes stop_codon:yes gene_type:complete
MVSLLLVMFKIGNWELGIFPIFKSLPPNPIMGNFTGGLYT